MQDCGESESGHAKAVLHVCEALAASGHTVISANTDENAKPPHLFAQSDEGELAFYWVRTDGAEPTPEELDGFRALAAKHGAAAYFAPVTLAPTPSSRGFLRL